ncbi:MAG: histone deacetylase family protein [Myxococcales bacterium]|nr:histone deacetylase family protein [Myxococcales bacterium]MCB9537916.1 histone deacetylase family protein [Myxococcales bacterium]
MSSPRIPAFFNEVQLAFKPLYEWAFGEKIDHPETTARAESILTALQAESALFDVRPPKEIPLAALRSQHSHAMLTLYNTARTLPEGETFYPMVFPNLKRGAGDPTNLHQAGAWCFDSGTPLNSQTLTAAEWSAACARDAASALRHEKLPLTYSLSRPPGHHATRDLFGGYCYFNNAAVAARYLRRFGRVAVVDIDFHHGNGTQSIFERDPKVLTVSLHGDPREHFPFFAGYAHETGAGPGEGYNLNVPLPTGIDGKVYLDALDRHALASVRHYAPEYLVVSAGLDGYHKDPVGHWALTTEDFHAIGERLGRLGLPTVVVQEGGYHAEDLGTNLVAVLRGLRAGQSAAGR